MEDPNKTMPPPDPDDDPFFVTLVGSFWDRRQDIFGNCGYFALPGPPPPLRLHRDGSGGWTEEVIYNSSIWEFSVIPNGSTGFFMVLSVAFGLVTVLSDVKFGPSPYGVYEFHDGCNLPPDYTITP